MESFRNVLEKIILPNLPHQIPLLPNTNNEALVTEVCIILHTVSFIHGLPNPTQVTNTSGGDFRFTPAARHTT